MPTPRRKPQTCAVCPTVFIARRAEQRYCSVTCSASARTRDSRVAGGRTGGQISGERRRRRALQRATARMDALLVNARRAAYRMGFDAGYAAAKAEPPREGLA